VFSGINSYKLWKEINALKTNSTIDDVRDVIYHLCCKLQELESKLDKEGDLNV